MGYAWKLEYGSEKRGFHCHLLLLLDGAKVRQDVTLARMLGEHWQQVITRGIGFYYNCNADKARYRKCGIGLIRHDDAEGMEGLQEAVKYLTKIDRCIQIFKLSSARIFGRSQMPAPKDPSAGGRPRGSESSRLSRDPN